MLSLKNIDDTSKPQLVRFLLQHENYTLFLLSNLEMYGFRLTADLYSGNYKALYRKDEIIAAFSLTKAGTLLFHSTESNPSLFEQLSLLARTKRSESQG